MKARAEDGVRVLHANLAVFGTEVMLHDEFPEFGGDVLAPPSRGGASLTISVNRSSPEDVDAAILGRLKKAPRNFSRPWMRSGVPLREGPGSVRPRLGLQCRARRMRRVFLFRIAQIAAALSIASPAVAACPIELAVYSDRDKVAQIDFTPKGEAAAVTNAFRLLLDGDTVLDGHVLWTDGIARPNGMILHECPEGDVTGEEIAACTVWQGVIYAVSDTGAIELLPRQGEPAPKALILPDLAHAVSVSKPGANLRPGFVPFDSFELSGCQE